MLIISAGMQKSGSAYIYNIIHDLLISAGHGDTRQVKEKYKLEDVLQWHNNNVGEIENKLLRKLTWISVKGKNFAVKTHSGPTPLVKRYLKLGLCKVIYIYRDPRDVLLSAIDHGKKIIAKGENHTFAQMIDFDKALENVKDWLKIWKEYTSMSNVVCIKYEDLMNHPKEITKQVCNYLKLDVPQKTVDEILFRYDRNNANANMTGLHFNKAQLERYKSEFTPEQLVKANTMFGETLKKMGYPVE